MKAKAWGVLVALAGGLWTVGCERPPSLESSPAGQAPSQVLEHFEMQDIRNGVKSMSLESVKARIYEDKQIAEVETPHLTFYQSGRESSRLNAPAGRVHTLTHDVEAWGGVTVVTPDSTTLTTEHLRYDAKSQKIYSEDPVKLEKPDSITEGKGLETDPGLKRVKIGKQKVRFKKGVSQ